METKKVLTIVFSLLAIFILGFAVSWSIINFNKVKDSMSGTELYTNEDLKNSYQDGYDTALKDKDEYDELINGYRDTITTLTDNVSALNSQITTLTNTNKDHQSQISNLLQIKEVNEQTIVELNNTISLNTSTIEGLNKEVINLNAQITSLDTIISNKELTINELNSQIAGLNNQIAGLNQTVSTNEQTIADLRITINTLNAEIEELSSNKVENENTISSLNNQVQELNNNIDTLTIENIRYKQTITELNNEISLLNTDIDNKENEIETLTTTNQSLNNQITNLNALIDDLEKVNESNLSTIGGLNNQIALQKSQIAELQNQVLNNDASIYELNTTISNLEKSIAYYENYIFELENQNHLVGIFEFDGTVYAICDADDNGKVTVANPTSTEYVIFNYWTVDGERVELSNYVLTKNTKFVANVTYKYNVKFLVDEEVYNSQIVVQYGYITTPEAPIKEKYNFLGWSIDGNNIVEIEDYEVMSNVTFVAIFQSTYGLFNPDTGAMVYSWQELQDYDYISVEENELKAGTNVKRISGNLIIDNDVTSIGASAFYNCVGISSVVIPDGVINIGTSAFKLCSSIKNISLPASLRTVGDGAFYMGNVIIGGGKYDLEQVDFRGTISDWLKIKFTGTSSSNPVSYMGNLVLNGEKLTGTIIVPEEITTIHEAAFQGFKNEIVLHEGITSIEKSAFFNSEISTINWPSNINKICSGTFNGCKNLKSFDFSNIEIIESGAFKGCSSLKYIYLPKTITSFATSVFDDCSGVETIDYDIITLPNSTAVTIQYFHENIGKDNNGFNFNVLGNVKNLPQYFMKCKYINTLTLHENLEEIHAKAFWDLGVKTVQYNCINCSLPISTFTVMNYLRARDGEMTINIGPAVTTLPSKFLYGADGVRKVDMNANNIITEIPYMCFGWADNINEIILPASLKTIKNEAFENCISITSITIPEGVTVIEYDAFGMCSKLTDIYLPSTLTTLGARVFNDCTSLITLYIPASVTTITSTIAYSASNLTTIYLGASNDDSYHYDWNQKSGGYFDVKYGYTYEQYLAEINSVSE